MSNLDGEPGSAEELFYLTGINDVIAVLKVDTMPCANSPNQIDWVFTLQICKRSNHAVGNAEMQEVLEQAKSKAQELHQTQQWRFGAEDVFPASRDGGSIQVDGGGSNKRVRLTRADGHANEQIPESNEPGWDAAAAFVNSSSHSVNDGQLVPWQAQSHSTSRKRKTSNQVLPPTTRDISGRPIAIPRSRLGRGRSDPMDWEAIGTPQEPQEPGQINVPTDFGSSAEIGSMLIREGSVNDVGASQPGFGSECAATPGGSTTSGTSNAQNRVATLVRAVVEGSRNFQADEDRRTAWMKELKAKPEKCSDAKALNATLLKKVNAFGMNQWVLHFLYGCSSLLVRGRARRAEATANAENRISAVQAGETAQGSPADSHASDLEGDSGTTAEESKDKRYRCRTLARIVLSLIDALAKRLDGQHGQQPEQAFNIIPALAAADCGFSQSSLAGWCRKNIEQDIGQVADVLMDPLKGKWRELDRSFRIDPARECSTMNMTPGEVRLKLGIPQPSDETYSEFFEDVINCD